VKNVKDVRGKEKMKLRENPELHKVKILFKK